MGWTQASLLVIGDEILSGRTREANAYFATALLHARGCEVREVAIVPDEEEAIVAALHRLRASQQAVITSGGIGPTHDDRTIEAVARALGRKVVMHEPTLRELERRTGRRDPVRARMARIPEGASVIACARSWAPAVKVENIYVLAGVPAIFRAQLLAVIDEFGGEPFHRREIVVHAPESSFAEALAEVQARFPDVKIGSYPERCGADPCGRIVLSGQNEARLEAAAEAVRARLG